VVACCREAPFLLLPRVVDAASLSLDGPAIGLNVISSPLDAEEEEGGTARRDEVADCGRDIQGGGLPCCGGSNVLLDCAK
jgi:hypothetical protein